MHGKVILSAVVCILLTQACFAEESFMASACQTAVTNAQTEISSASATVIKLVGNAKTSFDALVKGCNSNANFNTCVKPQLTTTADKIKASHANFQKLFDGIQAKLAAAVKAC